MPTHITFTNSGTHYILPLFFVFFKTHFIITIEHKINDTHTHTHTTHTTQTQHNTTQKKDHIIRSIFLNGSSRSNALQQSLKVSYFAFSLRASISKRFLTSFLII